MASEDVLQVVLNWQVTSVHQTDPRGRSWKKLKKYCKLSQKDCKTNTFVPGSKEILMKTVTNQHMKNVESRSSFNGTDAHYYQKLTQYPIVTHTSSCCWCKHNMGCIMWRMNTVGFLKIKIYLTVRVENARITTSSWVSERLNCVMSETEIK